MAPRGSERTLLADIGGTNARFALLERGDVSAVESLVVSEHAGVAEAIGRFLHRRALRDGIAAAVLGVAGPVEDGRCRITNSGWMIDAAELCARLGCSSVTVLNDFEALGWSLPVLTPPDLRTLGPASPRNDATMLVLGPGTGFGTACLVVREGRAFVVASEAGHATLPAESAREAAIIDHVQRRFGHVSIERIVSGPGLENLYFAIAAIDGADVPARQSAEITEAAIARRCDISRAALETFCAMLGSVAGNLALTFRAEGGVYIGGGIAPRIVDVMASSEFRARFEAKGRYRAYLEAIPTHVIMRPDAVFVALRAFAESERLPGSGTPVP